MVWIDLVSLSQLKEIDSESIDDVIILFKHSTRCSISDIALSRIKNYPGSPTQLPKIYYLDIFRYREISNEIEKKYHVYHESPQVLLIKNGDCFFDCSHLDISWPLIKDQIEKEIGILS